MARVVETVGIEVESIALTRNHIADILDTLPPSIRRQLRLDRDASVEFRATNISNNGMYINQHTDAYKDLFNATQGRVERGTTYGYEVTTSPLTIPEAERVLFNFMPILTSNGDFTHERAALHIHVGFGYSHKILKRLLQLVLKLDPLFFRLAGMGKKFRGESNAAIYCRPLDDGPTVLGNDGEYRKLVPSLAMGSNSSPDFFKRLGLTSISDVPRYHPGRYFGTNLFSLLLHGTVEFRHFNQTLNPNKAIALVKLCRAIVELVLYYDLDLLEELPNLSVHEEYPVDVYEKMLQVLIHHMVKTDVDFIPSDFEIEILMRILNDTPHHKLPKMNTLSHIRGYMLPPSLCKSIYTEVVKKPKESGFIDIHNISNASIIEEE